MRWMLAFGAASVLAAYQATGPSLIRAGRLEEALAAFRADLAGDAKSVAANNGAAVALDLLGRYAEARPYFSAAIKAARTPLDRALAERAMAIGYGFAADCRNAETLEQRAFEFYRDTSDFPNAGDVADEAARLCLNAGDLDRANAWYVRGHDTGVQEPNLSPARRDLWDFRLANARARLAARKGRGEEAQKQVAKAREILERGKIRDQQTFLPYLEGDVAFYAHDYAAAVQSLTRALAATELANDAFVECLLAQAYEKQGDREHAEAFYRKAATVTAHSVPASYGQPFARRKLASWSGGGR